VRPVAHTADWARRGLPGGADTKSNVDAIRAWRKAWEKVMLSIGNRQSKIGNPTSEQPSEAVNKSLACHPERSEGSPQFFAFT
jgi:hypothetical protein